MWLLAVYLGGVLIGLWRTDARWPARVGIALAWPLGPVAFVVTTIVLILASLVAYPLIGIVVAALAAAWVL